MRNVYEYILEAKETSSNKERLEQLRKWLKGKNYEEYVDALNKMLEDPKAKTLLDEGFGTEFGDLKFKYRAKLIAADELYPSQNEIDIDKTIGAPFKNPDNINKQYVNPIVIANMPLVTFNGKYIIDGHHRWSEIAVFNPTGKMLCFDYSANITIEQMLKAVQGTIAAVMAKKGEELPAQHVEKGHNIYDMSKSEIEKYVLDHENPETYARMIAMNTKLFTEEQAREYIINNLLQLKKDKKPLSNAPERGYMPQTSKGGSDTKDKQTAFPDKTGSALHNLSTKTVDKKTVQ
jgi:hypothetical protein